MAENYLNTLCKWRPLMVEISSRSGSNKFLATHQSAFPIGLMIPARLAQAVVAAHLIPTMAMGKAAEAVLVEEAKKLCAK